MNLDKLHVVCMYSNWVRYRSRLSLYKAFREHITNDMKMPLWTVELALGDRPFEATEPHDPHALRLRVGPLGELWQKERALNLMMQRLPSDWEYVAWVDSDLTFSRRDVFVEAVHQLQHHPVVQLWSAASDLGHGGRRVIKQAKSFAACFIDSGCVSPHSDGVPYSYAHPGYAWAATREFIDGVGGLLDVPPLGSADWYMAESIVQELTPHLNYRLKQGFTPNYVQAIASWQERAKRFQRDLGVVEGHISHHFHGAKAKRQYAEREQILIKNSFDPVTDYQHDWQGLHKLAGNKPQMLFDIRAYMRSRDEDSNQDE